VFPMPDQGGAIIYDPLSNPNPALRTPFPNNTIPGSRIDQAALYLIQRLPATTSPGYTNNVLTTGATEYNRTNYDVKLNYVGDKYNAFVRYGNSPHVIDDAYALARPAVARRAVDRSAWPRADAGPGRRRHLHFRSEPSSRLQLRLHPPGPGAEAPDIDENIGSDPDKMNISGTNGPDRMQGGLPSFQITNWSNLGNDNTGNPFQFNDDTYFASLNLQKQRGAHLFRGGSSSWTSRSTTSSPRAVLSRRCAARSSSTARPPCSRARPRPRTRDSTPGRHSCSECRPVPARWSSSSTRTRSTWRPTRLPPGHLAGQPQSDAGSRRALGAAQVADAARRQGGQPLRALGRVCLHRRLRRHTTGHLRQLR